MKKVKLLLKDNIAEYCWNKTASHVNIRVSRSTIQIKLFWPIHQQIMHAYKQYENA